MQVYTFEGDNTLEYRGYHFTKEFKEAMFNEFALVVPKVIDLAEDEGITVFTVGKTRITVSLDSKLITAVKI